MGLDYAPPIYRTPKSLNSSDRRVTTRTSTAAPIPSTGSSELLRPTSRPVTSRSVDSATAETRTATAAHSQFNRPDIFFFINFSRCFSAPLERSVVVGATQPVIPAAVTPPTTATLKSSLHAPGRPSPLYDDATEPPKSEVRYRKTSGCSHCGCKGYVDKNRNRHNRSLTPPRCSVRSASPGSPVKRRNQTKSISRAAGRKHRSVSQSATQSTSQSVSRSTSQFVIRSSDPTKKKITNKGSKPIVRTGYP